MASKFSNQHASALATVKRKGAEITLSRHVAGTVSDSTDVETGSSTTTIPGAAIEGKPDTDAYRALGLTHQNAITLFFTPTTIGDAGLAGDTLTWGSKLVTVRRAEGMDFDGAGAIAATLVCQR